MKKTLIDALKVVVAGAEEFWYHGRQSTSTEFAYKYAGKGNDQEGPGFYFTSDPKDAASYAYPSGIVIKVKLHLGKLLPKKAKASDIKTLIEKAPGLDDTLMNWDESPHQALLKAHKAMMNVDLPYQQVWFDFYRYDGDQYLYNLAALGYDGHEAARRDGVRHMIVYNPKAIEIIKVIKKK